MPPPFPPRHSSGAILVKTSCCRIASVSPAKRHVLRILKDWDLFMSKYHDDRTAASDRVAIGLSDAKLRLFHPELFGVRSLFYAFNWGKQKLTARKTRELIAEHMRFGDSRAALFVQVAPVLVVAAYTDEQDAVLLLKF